jgi:hypothetical protein
MSVLHLRMEAYPSVALSGIYCFIACLITSESLQLRSRDALYPRDAWPALANLYHGKYYNWCISRNETEFVTCSSFIGALLSS